MAPPVQAQGDIVEVEFWKSVKDSQDTSEVEAYLKAYPQGQFSPLAKIRLKKLRSDNSPGPRETQESGDQDKTVRETSISVPLHKCDRLAAHPQDPVRVADGVDWQKLDPKDAIAACQSALQTHPDSRRFLYQLGRVLNKAHSYKDAFEMHQKAANLDHALSMFELALAYHGGRGIDPNAGEAVHWYRKAAELNIAGAMYNLGRAHKLGFGVAKDLFEAALWYHRAAEKDHVLAMHQLGSMYAYGRGGIAKDEKEAVRWYQKAADRGHADAMNDLGFMYAKGRGVSRSQQSALGWYHKAADNGSAIASYVLAVRYNSGSGVKRDPEISTNYLLDAYQAGLGVARRALFRESSKLSISTRRAVQKRLKDKGHYNGSIDGQLGAKSRKAMESLLASAS